MPDVSSKTTQKRQQKENNDPSSKRQRSEAANDFHGAEESVEVKIEPDETFQSEEDTMDEIEYKEIAQSVNLVSQELSFSDLLIKAKLSYKRIKAIEMEFARKWRTGSLEFGYSFEQDTEKWIKILRFFGHKIENSCIDYQAIGIENRIKLDHCVNEYCADSLIKLKIRSAERYNMNHLDKPFSKIETIEFKDCHLTSQSTDFNRWFPMMRRLVFSGHNSLVDRKCIEAYFPYLKELEIEAKNVKEPVFEKSNVAKALRMNPNLMRLKISGDLFDVKFLCRVSQYLQRLESLEIEWELDIFACLDLLHQCKSLKSFHFQLERDSNFDDLNNSLRGEWQASNEGGFVKLDRVTDVSTEAQNGQTSEHISVDENDGRVENQEEEWSEATESDEATEFNSDEIDFSDFKNMELNELLQAAESNAERKLAIDTEFLDKYPVNTVQFSPSYAERISAYYENGVLFTGHITVCLDFLNLYGHRIKKISFEFHDEILYHLNQYCADSLIELNISRTRYNRVQKVRDIKKPFAKLEMLEFRNCFLNSRLTDFNKWFPQVRSIKLLRHTILDDDSCIAVPFPHLEHLTIDIPTTRRDNEYDVFNVENVKLSLRLNPQLRSVGLHNIDAKFLRGVSEHLQCLESLDIKWNKDVHYSELMGHTIQFKSVQKLDVKFHPDDINAQEIPLSFDQLQSLTLEAEELNDNLLEFIGKHLTITKLSLSLENAIDLLQIIGLAKALPSLKKFNLNFTMCSLGGIFGLLEVCQSLKKLQFTLDDRTKYESFRQLLDDKWQASIDYMDYVQLKRRANESG